MNCGQLTRRHETCNTPQTSAVSDVDQVPIVDPVSNAVPASRENAGFRSSQLATPWVDSPFFTRLLDESALDAEEKAMVRHFAEYGWVVIDPEIPSATLDGAVRDVRDRYNPGGDGYYSDERRIQDAWNFSDNVRKIAAASRVLEILAILYRRPPFPFQTLNFRIGSEQRTHSDQALFDSLPHGFMCGVWVALENVDEGNGPLHYYPGSHKPPVYNLYDLGVVASEQSHALERIRHYEDFVESLMESVKPPRQTLRIEKGQALIWAANLFHGGCPILEKGRTRFSQVTHYYFGGCVYYTPLMSDPALGRIATRVAFNAAQGRIVPQYYQGRRVENPGEWPPRLSAETPIEDPMAFPTRVPRSAVNALLRSFDVVRDRFF